MPLMDHFRAPLAPSRHWESFHVNWAGAIADVLNLELLPEGYFAEEHAQLGPMVEIDCATFGEGKDGQPAFAPGPATLTQPARTWAPAAPALVIPGAFPDSFEVLVFASEGGTRLVAAIEMVSPANKDRPAHRQAFCVKCASYLARGISLIVIDVMTRRRANLHQQILELLGQGENTGLPAEAFLYAVAYRPIVRNGAEQIEIWPSALAVGEPLPVLPLALNAEICLPIDLEATYTTACHRRRLPT